MLFLLLNDAVPISSAISLPVLPTLPPFVKTTLPAMIQSQQPSIGFYYGITPKTYNSAVRRNASRQRRLSVSETMRDALEEIRMLRKEMLQLQQDMDVLLKKSSGAVTDQRQRLSAQQKQKLSLVSKQVERWAQSILSETDDWKEVTCNKMMRGSFNKDGRTTAYIKWLKDSREDMADSDDETEYPCIKCYSTIDAPLEEVCMYLSQESVFEEYNDIVIKHHDIENLTPDSKICWSQSPQILFLKPRDFVTYCHHRWDEDGTQIIVNQACTHPDYPGNDNDDGEDGKFCRALALRGVNYIARDPTDATKTQITLIAHANPGGNVPQWAVKTAVNALAPIEPFKLFHKINHNVVKHQKEIRKKIALQMEDAAVAGGIDNNNGDDDIDSNVNDGPKTASRKYSKKPAGMAQLGYACFWPNGGGIDDSKSFLPSSLDVDGSEEEAASELSTSLDDN